MGKQDPYSTTWVKSIVVVLYIYGALAMFLNFFNNQETESEWREMEIGVAQPISTKEKNQSIYGTRISIINNMGENNCGNYSYLWC